MYLDDAVQATAGFEGRIHWMYLDTKGNVTVGVGQLLPTPDAASEFRFRRHTAEFATQAEIRAEFVLVRDMKAGLVPLSYRRFSSLLLASEDIDSNLSSTMADCVLELGKLFPDFQAYPDPAKIALLDMRFNLGITRLREEFPKFCALVKAQNWLGACLESRRQDIAAHRNDWTAEQFMLASGAPHPFVNAEVAI
jgi:GH24 family phage-related lysozyme (muramidase)